MRKPKSLSLKPKNPSSLNVYAGIFDGIDDQEYCVYIGGDYYQDGGQIHLTKAEVLKLAPWLNKVAEYLKGRTDL